MRRDHLNIIFLTLFMYSYGQNVSFSKDKDPIVFGLSSVIGGNKDLYLNVIYNKSALLYCTTKGQGLKLEEQAKVDQVVAIAYDRYLEEQTARFVSIQSKVKELRIDWTRTIVDSISIRSDGDDMHETSSGTIYFRNKDNSEFYKMNFQGLLKLEGRYFIETLFVPHLYAGAKNRLLTASIKQQYIDTCVAKTKYLISITKGDVLTKLYGDCVPCHCARQYISDSEQENGIDLIQTAIKRGTDKLRKRSTATTANSG